MNISNKDWVIKTEPGGFLSLTRKSDNKVKVPDGVKPTADYLSRMGARQFHWFCIDSFYKERWEK